MGYWKGFVIDKVFYELNSLIVYDLLGNEVERLVEERQHRGTYSVAFDAEQFTSGVYFYKLSSDGNDQIIKKMVILK